LEELNREQEMDSRAAVVEAERVTLESALADLAHRRKKAIDLNLRGTITDAELDEQLVEVTSQHEGAKQRLEELQATLVEPEESPLPDVLEELRRRLDNSLDDAQRQEIVSLLVKRITVYTEEGPGGKKKNAKVLIEYRFPGVVNVNTDTGSWPPPS